MTNAQVWSNSTKAIFLGVILYSVAGVLYPIFDFVNSMAEAVNTVSKYATGSKAMDFSLLAIIVYLLLAAIIFGYYLYLKGLIDFEKAVDPADAENVKKVRTATILVLIGFGLTLVFSILPIFGDFMSGFIGGILNIVAYILMLIAFSGLKNSSTFPKIAQQGANFLFVAMILLLCAVVLGWIPFIGGVMEIIVSVVAFIFVLLGWLKIKSAAVTA
jgi:hypothetical protein